MCARSRAGTLGELVLRAEIRFQHIKPKQEVSVLCFYYERSSVVNKNVVVKVPFESFNENASFYVLSNLYKFFN